MECSAAASEESLGKPSISLFVAKARGTCNHSKHGCSIRVSPGNFNSIDERSIRRKVKVDGPIAHGLNPCINLSYRNVVAASLIHNIESIRSTIIDGKVDLPGSFLIARRVREKKLELISSGRRRNLALKLAFAALLKDCRIVCPLNLMPGVCEQGASLSVFLCGPCLPCGVDIWVLVLPKPNARHRVLPATLQ